MFSRSHRRLLETEEELHDVALQALMRRAHSVQEMQKKIAPLIEEAQSRKGNPEEIRPKVLKIRKEHERKLEGILSAAQKKQWKEMLGKALSLDD